MTPAPVPAAITAPEAAKDDDDAAEEPAPPPKTFGDARVLVLGASLWVHNVSYSNSSASQFGYSIEPSVDYFIGKPLSLGGFVMLRHSDDKGYDIYGPVVETRETGYGIGARMGLNLRINGMFSVWPKLLFAYTYYTGSAQTAGSTSGTLPLPSFHGSYTLNANYVEAQLPLIAQLAPHFFAGAGPIIYADIARSITYDTGRTVDSKRTGTSLALTLGGWI